MKLSQFCSRFCMMTLLEPHKTKRHETLGAFSVATLYGHFGVILIAVTPILVSKLSYLTMNVAETKVIQVLRMRTIPGVLPLKLSWRSPYTQRFK